MNLLKLRTMAQLREFVQGTQTVQFAPLADADTRYRHVARVIAHFGYARLGRADRSVVLRYLERTSGYSSAQIKRLVARALQGQVLRRRYVKPVQAYAQRFTDEDIVALAQVDRAFGTLSGAATTHVLWRQWHEYGDARFQRLSTISVSHLYNLRKSARYERERVQRSKTTTSGRSSQIGQRRPPEPRGQAGFIRIDSVHQGDFDGTKGLYHINAVDCVTQWQVVATVQTISEAHLLPVIEQMLAQFPFEILGFHADNGSEYVNHRVAQMLDKLRIEFTRSRPRRSNDNGLAETKNGAVVRKIFGYAHIPQRHAARFNTFCAEYLNPFLNLHRPCLFATELPDAKKPGRIKRVYRPQDAMTPLDKLASLPDAAAFLREGVTLEELHQLARALTDVQAAQELNEARAALFRRVPARTG